MESLRLTTTLPAAPEDVYDAWLSGERHTAMTGGAATSERRKGGVFTAWGGYVSGRHLELVPGKRILQSWRTTEFPEAAPDSRLEIRLAKTAQGTRLTLLQSGIPDGQSEMYSDGWQDHYFAPMSRYFGKTAPARPAKKSAKKSAKRRPSAGKKKKRREATTTARRTPPAARRAKKKPARRKAGRAR